MKQTLRQLRLLLWKNYTLRKRNKVRCLMEIAWPVCLFLLLALVRMKGFQTTIHQCHFEEKHLPSSGALTFYRSMICSLNNTCHKKPFSESQTVPSMLFKALKEIEKMNLDSISFYKKFQSFESVLGEIGDELQKQTSLNPSQSKTKLLRLIKNVYEKMDEVDSLINIIETIESASETSDRDGKLKEAMEKYGPIFNNILNNFYHFFCGNMTKLSLEMFLDSQKSSYHSYLDAVVPNKEKLQQTEDETSECNNLFREIEYYPDMEPLWAILKPYIRGKIVYSPDTPLIRKIMDQVKNSLIPPVLHVLKFQYQLFQVHPDLMQIVLERNLFIQELNANVSEKNDKLRDITDSLNKTLDKFQSTINRLSSNIYKLKITKWNELNLTLLIECYSNVDRFEGYSNEKLAETRSRKLCDDNTLLAEIHFYNTNNFSFQPDITYKIRMNTNRLPSGKTLVGESGPSFRPFTDLKLITLGFIYLQDSIERAILIQVTGRTDLPTLSINQMPYPCYIHDWFMTSVLNMFPMFMMLSWVYTCSMIVKNIVFEKEQRLKETMRILGLSNSLLWLGWFLDSFFFLTFACLFLSIVLVYGGILGHADVTLIFVYLMTFSVTTIATSFLISVFFSKANIAASSGGLIFFILYLPFAFLEYWPSYFGYNTKILMCLLSNVAFAVGSKHLAMLEVDGIGAQWSNITDPCESVSLLTIILLLLFDSCIYCLLAWYIENIFPGDYGVPKKWYFLGTKQYWCGTEYSTLHLDKTPDVENNVMEAEPIHLPRGVVIKNLTKVYGNGKVAVTNLNIRFYESQITAFLGKNGAGKTTTLSILSGLLPPTSGTAYVYGLDIRTDSKKVRRALGVCPQHNILFAKLTVEEQLWFYARLRGHTPAEAQLEVRQALADLGLENKRNNPISHLSGGMQRKLCIVIAFIGKSKTIILDEPTAGVDPFSRTAIWNLILKYKQGRTIIMTTHSMSEAEILSDRIAIFSCGRVLCNGSISFLRETFGQGYHLTVDIGFNLKQTENNFAAVTEAIQSKIDQVEVLEEYGSEIKYTLPNLADNIDNYSQLFIYLYDNKIELGIRSFGLSDTSLEEIFVKLIDQDEMGTYNVPPPDEKVDFPRCEENSWRISMMRFHALSYKRFHHFKRLKTLIFCATILPALFTLLTLAITSSVPELNQPVPKPIDISSCVGCSTFFQSNYSASQWITKYTHEIIKRNGLSAFPNTRLHADRQTENFESLKLLGIKDVDTIINPRVFPDSQVFCKNISDVLSVMNISKLNYMNDCSCETGKLDCLPTSTYEEVQCFNITEGISMINVTGAKISDWILNTWQQFQDIRTGGYSLNSNSKTNASKDPFSRSNSDYTYNSSDDIIKIWFNNKWFLSPSVYLNAINNVILRASMPAGTSDKFALRLIYHPMNYTETQYQYEIVIQVSSALLHSVSIIFVLGFVPASYLLYVIEENINNSKHLQFLFGVSPTVYWVQAFIWDLIFYVLTTWVCILVYFAFYVEAYVANGNFIYMFLLFFLYGWACIPLMYLGSFLFNVPSSAFVILSSFNVFIGITTSASVYVLRLFNDEDLINIEYILRDVFLIFPHFCLGEGMIKMAEIYLVSAIMKTYGSDAVINKLSWNHLGRNYFSMFLTGTLAFSLVLLVEHFHGKKILREHLRTLGKLDEGEEDVEEERRRVLSGTDDDILVLKYLSKIYKKERIVAVNQVCLGIGRGECFGLLGVNGAGKSTTFNMLTGKTSITFGDALIEGQSVRYSMDKVKSKIGYCPQVDALDPLLTPKEHLWFYTRLRGVPQEAIPPIVNQALNCFDLDKMHDITTKKLSGGYKRKLSTALALLGNPSIVFMDEPTCGMDVKGRRFLWKRLKDRVKNGATLMLTSHALVECEALCSRLTVMVRGRFTCLGSVQHLKNKYGKGYSMTVRAPFNNLELAKEEISKDIPQAIEVCCYSEQIRYSVDLSLPELNNVFKTLERLKSDRIINNYSVSQNSLEQVFLHFVDNHVFDREASDQSLFCPNLICNVCKWKKHPQNSN